jgi:hypothetical protein
MNTPCAAIPKTDCNHQPLLFQDLGARQVVADFSGGYLSSDGGALLLRQLDRGLGLTRTLAQAFTDRRDPRYCDHTLPQLLSQRLCGLALGYEDLNDHDTLRHDPLLAAACDKPDPLGRDRLHAADAGVALAGSATLNRLELGNHRHTTARTKSRTTPRGSKPRCWSWACAAWTNTRANSSWISTRWAT